MKGFKRTGVAVAIAALFALGTSATGTPAEAMPSGVQMKHTVDSGAHLQQVRDGYRGRYRGPRHRRHGYYDDWDDGWWGLNPGAAIALGVTGALINEAARDDGYYGGGGGMTGTGGGNGGGGANEGP